MNGTFRNRRKARSLTSFSEFETMRSSLLFAIVPLVVFGCGGGEYPTTPVTGVCTAEGQPVEAGELVFHPKAENAPPSIAKLGEGGRFELSNTGGKGAAVAVHTVLYVPPETVENEDGTAGDVSKYRGWGVPEGFTVEIGPNSGTVEIELVRQ